MATTAKTKTRTAPALRTMGEKEVPAFRKSVVSIVGATIVGDGGRGVCVSALAIPSVASADRVGNGGISAATSGAFVVPRMYTIR